MIHSFDPKHLSMPQYSSKYTEMNVAAIRHLIGGEGCSNVSDISSSNVHWTLGLRNYNKKKFISNTVKRERSMGN